MTAKYYARDGMKKTEIEKCDSIELVTDDGQRIELTYRKSDGEIVVSASGRIVVRPTAANCFRVEDQK